MKIIYSQTKFFRRMVNHILQLGEAEVLHTSESTTIEIVVTDKKGGHVGYLIIDSNKHETQIFLRLSEWAASKYADLDD